MVEDDEDERANPAMLAGPNQRGQREASSWCRPRRGREERGWKSGRSTSAGGRRPVGEVKLHAGFLALAHCDSRSLVSSAAE